MYEIKRLLVEINKKNRFSFFPDNKINLIFDCWLFKFYKLPNSFKINEYKLFCTEYNKENLFFLSKIFEISDESFIINDNIAPKITQLKLDSSNFIKISQPKEEMISLIIHRKPCYIDIEKQEFFIEAVNLIAFVLQNYSEEDKMIFFMKK